MALRGEPAGLWSHSPLRLWCPSLSPPTGLGCVSASTRGGVSEVPQAGGPPLSGLTAREELRPKNAFPSDEKSLSAGCFPFSPWVLGSLEPTLTFHQISPLNDSEN